MKVELNALIFTSEIECRTDVRRLRPRTLQLLLDKNNKLPSIELEREEYSRETIVNKVKDMLGVDRMYVEQLYTWAIPEYYTENSEVIITYLMVLNKNDIVKEINDYNFYSISIKDINNSESKKEQIVMLSNEPNNMMYKIDTIRNYGKYNNVEYINKVDKNPYVDELTGIIIHTGIKRLRNRIQNTNIAFNFLNEEFTISDLQQIYEIILDKPMVSANFRKKIAPMVKKKDKIEKDSAYRPAAKFVFNKDYIEDWV